MDIGQIKDWAELVRDVGLILGIPVVIGVAMKLYVQQIKILKERAELLKETQYDRALSVIKSQRQLYELERQSLNASIEELESSLSKSTEALSEKENETTRLRDRLEEVTETIGSLDRSASMIERATFAEALFRHDAIFRQSTFEGNVDFSESVFASYVSFAESLFRAQTSFEQSVFRGHVIFDDADLRSASFNRADLRGVDLSFARVDKNTKLPRLP